MKPLVIVVLGAALSACATVPTHWLSSAAAPSPPKAAAAADDSLPKVHLAFRKFTLANGLTLIVHEDHQAPVVALDLWYHVGSKDEPDGQHGDARLTERLMASGETGTGALVPAAAEALRGDVNRDRTRLSQTLPPSALDAGLASLAQRMRVLPGASDAARLAAQRDVLERDLQRRLRQPYGDIPAVIARSTYPPGHPYAWTSAGSIRALDATTPDRLHRWFDDHYGAANATLVVSGDVDAEQVKARVEHDFAGIAAGPPVSHVTAWPARMNGERRSTVQAEVPQARLYMVWNLPPAMDADTARLRLAAAILADGQDSLLHRALTHDKPLATAVSATVRRREIGSQFVITVDASHGVALDKIERTVDLTLARLLADGPAASDLKRVRVSLFANTLRRLQSAAGQARLLAQSDVYGGTPDAYRDTLDVLRAASADDVRDSLRNWLADGVFVLDVVPAKHYSAAVVSTAAPASVTGDHPSPAGLPAPALLPALQRATLANGMTLLLASRPGAPLVDFDMLFAGGRASDANLPRGTAAATFALLHAGAAQHSAQDIDGALQAEGATLADSVTADAASLQLSVLKDHLGDAFALYADVIRHPAFPDAAIAAYKQHLLAAIAQQKASPDGIARRLLTRLLYGAGHPYAVAGRGVPGAVRALKRDDLTAYAQQWIRPDNATLLAVGDIDMDRLKALATAQFGDWKAGNVPVTQPDIPAVVAPAGPRVFLVDDPGASHSTVIAATLAPPPSDQEQPALMLINTALGGNFLSRLNLDLHDVKHWSNDVFSGEMPMRASQVFYTGAAVPADHTADVMAEMRKQIGGIASGQAPFSDVEIEAAKQAAARRLPANPQTPGEFAQRYRRMLTLGLPADYEPQLAQRLQALTSARLQSVAKSVLNPDALTWIVIGDQSKIGAAVRALDLGAVQVVNADGKSAAAAPADVN